MGKKKSAKSAAPKKAAPVKRKKRRVEQYDHPEAERLNNPPVGLVTPESEPLQTAKKTYQYDPHLDPQLVWAGKAEHTSFQVPTVSLHVHERIDPRTIIEAVKAKNGKRPYTQRGLFDDPEEQPAGARRSSSTSTSTAGRIGSSPATRCW